MWKIALGFIVFAALALFILMRSGGNIDMGGEKHGVDAGSHSEPAASAASVPADMPMPAASAASQ